MKPVLAVTVGDYNGIGPEVALRSLLRPALRRACTPLLVGPMEVFAFYARRFRIPLSFVRWSPGARLEEDGRTIRVVEPSRVRKPLIRPGRVSVRAGLTALRSLHAGVRLVQEGWADALVTAPVSKKALHLAGSRFPGQTELLQKLTGSPAVAMMLVSERMRIGLVTIHLPIRRVARALTGRVLATRLRVMHRALRTDWGIRRPRIAVLALNPHAGEKGRIGTEEQRIITPVLRALRKEDIRAEGPFPADSFFGTYRSAAWDAVAAMYHDQGLIPLKYSSFGRAVNYTAGLPLIRTSPDHGTAFDIAGKGVADTGSMEAALALALTMVRNRP